MKYTAKNHNGFALLYIMLILASLIVAFSLAASQSGVFSAHRSRIYIASAEVRMLAQYCGENLLMQVRNNPATNASGTLSYNSGSCTYSITGTSPTKTISIVATKNNLYKRLTITTSQVTPEILSVWVETI